jgi:two-component system phosphate regulon sensor histidine kinase PhoR
VKLGIRARLVLVWLLPVAAALLVADVYLTRTLDQLLVGRIREDLLARLSLCERDASAAAEGDAADWSRLAHDLGTRAGARMTLIGTEGVVLGDSEVSAADLGRLENHAGRPEVMDAVARGRGSSVRYSVTLERRMMYAAVPFRRGGAVAGVVRIAMPLTEVDQAVGRLHRAPLVAGALALGTALVLALGLSHWVSRGLRQLTAMARRMAKGDLEVRTRVRGQDEVAELGQALDTLAASLAGSLADLRAQRDLVSRILTGMQEGVLLLDADGRLALVNPALRQMLLLDGDVIGRPLLEVMRHGPLKEVIDRARAEEGGATAEIEVLGLRPRQLLVRVARLADEPAGLLAVFVDVTDLRRLESVRRDFVANASHELRTPIAAVRSAAETLRTAARADPEAAARFLEIIERNAERLQRLIEDLLDLSRIEARELRLNLESLEVGAVVERTLVLFQEPAARRRTRLRAAIPEDLPPVRADRRALEQVLTNLIDNAVKYCPDGAEVTVRADAERDLVRFVVEDTGPGIEGRHLSRLFERFYRVDAGRSRELGGTGLGLSIVKHLVEAMGGTVGVSSVPGEGSRFSVTLTRSA